MHIAARTKSRAFYNLMHSAGEALNKAMRRPTEQLNLTTGEYQAIRTGVSWYLRSLPSVEVGALNEACMVAARALGELKAA
jgi:hypothetical protein